MSSFWHIALLLYVVTPSYYAILNLAQVRFVLSSHSIFSAGKAGTADPSNWPYREFYNTVLVLARQAADESKWEKNLTRFYNKYVTDVLTLPYQSFADREIFGHSAGATVSIDDNPTGPNGSEDAVTLMLRQFKAKVTPRVPLAASRT